MNKKILITGGSKGIGKSIAEKFIAEDYNVTLTSTNHLDSSFLAKRINHYKIDFLDNSAIENFLSYVEDSRFDIIINNAGVNTVDYADALDLDDYRKIQRINTETPLRIIQKSLPHMKDQNWGRIINIASIFSVVSKARRASYSASKNALVGLTKAIGLEVASQGILVNCVSPGFIETELTSRVLGESGKNEIKKSIPIGRLGKPNEIAEIVYWLASPQNTYLTCQNLVIDGGFVSG